MGLYLFRCPSITFGGEEHENGRHFMNARGQARKDNLATEKKKIAMK